MDYAIVRSLLPLSILLNASIAIFLVVQNFKIIRSSLRKVSWTAWTILAGLTLVGLLLRIFLVSHSHVMYTDEAHYMLAAKNMLQSGFQDQGDYTKSIGWPFIISIAFGLFGVSNWVAVYSSIFLGALTAAALFLLCHALTKSTAVSLTASAMLMLMPVHMRWSATAETNVASVLFIIIAAYFCVLHCETRKRGVMWLATASLAFSFQFRPENYLLILLFLAGLLAYRTLSLSTIMPMALLILAVPNFIQVHAFQTGTNWVELQSQGEESGDNWSLQNLLRNTAVLGPEVFGVNFPAVLIPLLIIGSAYCFWRRSQAAIFLSVWIAVLWIGYFSSWIHVLGARERFYMGLYPAITILASFGVYALARPVSHFARMRETAVFTILSALVLLSMLPSAATARVLFNDEQHMLETRLPELAERDIPKGCIIYANWPEVLTSTTDLKVHHLTEYRQSGDGCQLLFVDISCLDIDFGGTKERCAVIVANATPYRLYSEKNITYGFYELRR